MAVKVGSFTKATSTDVPVTQAVTGVGFQPKALLLWTAGNTSVNTWTDGYLYAIGMTTAANASGSTAIASQDDVSPTNTTSRTVAKALTIVQWGESVLAECDLASFDANGFTLSWTTNNDQAYIINYMAIGGTEVTGAKVVSWQTPSSTGDNAVTGAGFTPGAVLHLIGYQTSLGSNAGANLGIGAMDSSQEWAMALTEPDARNASDRARRIVTSGVALRQIRLSDTTGAAHNVATYTSMDADGFTVNFSTANANYYVYSLCLAGEVDVGVYSFVSTDDQAVTGVGFVPGGVLQASMSLLSTTSANTQVRTSFGAMDAEHDRAMYAATGYNANPNDSASYTSNAAAVLLTLAAADREFRNTISLVSLDADGFTVAHSGTAISSPGWLVGYLAVGGAEGGGIIPHAMYYKRQRS